ncbi:hypothetical protein PVAP13_9KG490452 [Panicum virgatum]|uniref:Uncharacterized protein n=1 Tax=Panicum virgatum TaxID=38727 RepID=A0A8T0NU22_PANVG|nr:hypothetical protein PVAP13_9KG490452 [Panicum virgatum]
MAASQGQRGGPAIGIDLGTTYSCVAVWRHDRNRAEVIANDQGERLTPSCVAFTAADVVVGDAAADQAAANPAGTIFGEETTHQLLFLHSLATFFILSSRA